MAHYCKARSSIRATQQHRAKEKETPSKFACMTQMRGFPAGNRYILTSYYPKQCSFRFWEGVRASGTAGSLQLPTTLPISHKGPPCESADSR